MQAITEMMKRMTAMHGNDEDDDSEDDDSNDGGDEDNNNNDEMWHINDLTNNDEQPPKINIPDAIISSPPASPRKNAGVGSGNTGVGEWNTDLIDNDTPGYELNSNAPETDNSREQDELSQAMDQWYGNRAHTIQC